MKRKAALPLLLAVTMLPLHPVLPVYGEEIPDTGIEDAFGTLPIRGHEAVTLSENYAFDAVDDMLNYPADASSFSAESAFPASYDSKNLLDQLHAIYPEIRNQAPYGACWAFASTGTAEQNMIRDHGKTPSIDYSEAHLVHYSYNNAANPVLTKAHDQSGDIMKHKFKEGGLLNYGGHNMMAMEVLSHWKGVVDEAYAPYGTLSESKWQKIDAFSGDVAVQTGWYQISMDNPELIKAWIREHGGVAMSYCHEDSFVDIKHNSYYCDEDYAETHSAMIVGWDDNFPRTSFLTRAEEDGAWLIRNSWGSDGMNPDGYFWMSYCDKTLGGTTHSCFVQEMSERVEDNNYYYDCNFHDFNPIGRTAANVFEASASETESLDSVNFLFELEPGVTGSDAAPGTAEVTIYRDCAGEDPASGTVIAKQTGIQLPYTGRYTVSLDEPPILDQGDRFSVVVTVTGGYVCAEADFVYWTGLNALVSGNKGESFYLDEDLWVDCSKRGNACISAQTRNVIGTPAKIDSVSLDETIFEYTGAAIKPQVTVFSDGRLLTADKHYTVSYKNNVEPGMASVTVTGLGRYYGSQTVEYAIIKTDNAYGNNYEPKQPENVLHEVELENGALISVSYRDAINFRAERIRPETGLSARTDLSDFTEKLLPTVKDALSHLQVSYVCPNKAADENAFFYPKLTVLSKGLSKTKQRAMEEAVSMANERLAADPCRFTINRRSLLDGTVKVKVEKTKKGKIRTVEDEIKKVKSIKFTFSDTGKTIRLNTSEVSLRLLDPTVGSVKVYAEGENYSGAVTVFVN